MMTPSMVSADRSLFTRMARSAMRTLARTPAPRRLRPWRPPLPLSSAPPLSWPAPPPPAPATSPPPASSPSAAAWTWAGCPAATSVRLPASSRSTRPSLKWMTRCPCEATSGSCVTKTMVMPFSRLSVLKSSMISAPVWVSRLPVGSSARMILGSLSRARAMATRCCWPPDNWVGRCVTRSPRPTSSSISRALRRPSAVGTPL